MLEVIMSLPAIVVKVEYVCSMVFLYSAACEFQSSCLLFNPEMPYGIGDLGHLWFRQWLVAWRHQTITWNNINLS